MIRGNADMNVFSSGRFSVTVPEGWMAFCTSDSDGKPTPKKAHIYKGISFQTDIFTHVGITVCFFDRDDYRLSTKRFYDNIEDIEPFSLGPYIWNGYRCTSFGYPYTMLEAERDGYVFQVMILMKNGEHEISLGDIDVKTIIGSLMTLTHSKNSD